MALHSSRGKFHPPSCSPGIENPLDDGQDNMIGLVLLEHGSTQSGSIRMCAGDGIIFEEGPPYSVDNLEYSEYTSVRLPRHVVDMASLGVDRLPLRPFDATRGAGGFSATWSPASFASCRDSMSPHGI